MKCLPDKYYNSFLSDLAKERKPSPSRSSPLLFSATLINGPVRSLFPLERTPGLISLLAGKPNASTFPFTSLSFNARSPTHPDEESTLTIDGAELEQGLQYGDTAGLKSLLDWIQGLQELNHGRKKDEGWRISIGSGSQDLIFKVIFYQSLLSLIIISTNSLYQAVNAMVNPGESVLVESPVYA